MSRSSNPTEYGVILAVIISREYISPISLTWSKVLVSSRTFQLYFLITFFVGVQNHPRRDEMGQIKYDPVTSKLNSIPASMLTDKYSFIGCLQVLEQIFENSKPNNTESTKQSSGSSATSSNGVTPPPGVAPPGPPPGVGSGGGSANGSPVGSPPGSQRSNRTQFPTLDKDMTKMGISFIKDNRLIYRFQSPFADMPCRVQDIDMFVPGEYLTNIHIREKLAEIKVNTGMQNRNYRYFQSTHFWLHEKIAVWKWPVFMS